MTGRAAKHSTNRRTTKGLDADGTGQGCFTGCGWDLLLLVGVPLLMSLLLRVLPAFAVVALIVGAFLAVEMVLRQSGPARERYWHWNFRAFLWSVLISFSYALWLHDRGDEQATTWAFITAGLLVGGGIVLWLYSRARSEA